VSATGSSATTTSLKIKSFSDLSAAQGSAGRQTVAAAGGGAAAHWTKVEGRPTQDTGRVINIHRETLFSRQLGAILRSADESLRGFHAHWFF